jgi:DNA-binding FadR family transcriptional regulator
MRKPISKHLLRRALERVKADGFIEYQAPVGTVVDKIWHEIEKKTYASNRKKPLDRESVRTAAVTDVDLDAAEGTLGIP